MHSDIYEKAQIQSPPDKIKDKTEWWTWRAFVDKRDNRLIVWVEHDFF